MGRGTSLPGAVFYNGSLRKAIYVLHAIILAGQEGDGEPSAC